MQTADANERRLHDRAHPKGRVESTLTRPIRAEHTRAGKERLANRHESTLHARRRPHGRFERRGPRAERLATLTATAVAIRGVSSAGGDE